MAAAPSTEDRTRARATAAAAAATVADDDDIDFVDASAPAHPEADRHTDSQSNTDCHTDTDDTHTSSSAGAASAAPAADDDNHDANVAWVRAHLLPAARWLSRHHELWSPSTAQRVAGEHGLDKLESAIHRRGLSPASALLGINWDAANTRRIKYALAQELAGARRSAPTSFVSATKLHDAGAMFRLVQGYGKQLSIRFIEDTAAEDAVTGADAVTVTGAGRSGEEPAGRSGEDEEPAGRSIDASPVWDMLQPCPVRAVLKVGSAARGSPITLTAAAVLRRLAQDADNDNA